MGIFGDSFTHYNSAIFEGKNFTDSLSVLDKEILKFLYSNYAPGKRIRRVEFEERYAAILYKNLTAEKLEKLSTEYNLDEHDLRRLADMIFLGDSNEVFMRFPRDIFYKLEGTYASEEIEFFKVLVAELNNTVPHLEGKLTEENTYWNKSPSLTIHFDSIKENGKKLLIVSNYTKNKSKMMYEYKLGGNVRITLNDPGTKYKNKIITFAVLRGLGLKLTDGDVLRDTSLSNLKINEKYADYLRFLYDPSFPTGISKMEYERLIKEIE